MLMIRSVLASIVLATASWPIPASTQQTPPTQTNPAVAVPIVLPQAYDSTISSLGALATGAAAALKSHRSDARKQLVAIRETSIDLSNEPDCKNISVQTQRPSGVPNAVFVGCWRAAWAKLQPQVANLATVAEDYDTIADTANVNAQKLFGTIMADYALISSGRATDAQNLAIFANDITEFIALANTIANAASTSNVSSLKTAIAGGSK